jgi:16S rRNA (guanine527-N7)-methyltransferase
MTSRLVLDAAALVSVLPELAEATRLADLGSGAGFPGLPIAILRPHLAVHLVEARRKRHHFQREARRQLELTHAHPILGRSEAVEPIACEIAVAQAMAQPAKALELLAPWTCPGGLMILPATAGNAPPSVPVDHRIETRAYRVPFAEVHRLLWVVHRPRL